MRAVNLIPADTRRSGLDAQALRGPGPAVVGLLAVALALVTMYVLASNSISQRRTELSSVRQQLAQIQTDSGSLTRYSQFTALAQVRTQTVQQIAASRFDWAKALSGLADVVPANTSLESLSASVNPNASTGSSGASLRGDVNVPAFELVGCTTTQDDVARLMSRLRLINGVTRVTLSDSVKAAAAAAGASVSSTGAPGAGCGAGAPTFDVIVFFQAPAVAPVTTTPAGTAAPASTTTPASSTPPTTTTPTSSTPTAGTTTPPSATPASTSTGGAR